MAFSFITFFRILLVPLFLIVYMVVCFECFLFNFVNYIYFLLCLCILIVRLIYSDFYVCSVLCILFHYVVVRIVLSKCVLYYCHRVSAQLHLTNTRISRHNTTQCHCPADENSENLKNKNS